MVYWINNGKRGRHRLPVVGSEPDIEDGAHPHQVKLRSILFFGRALTDAPGTKTEFHEGMRPFLPTTVLVDEVPKTGAPDFSMGGFGCIVSPILKDKLEELEPHVHQFFPVRVKHCRTAKDLGEYFLMYVDTKPDIIDHDRTLYMGSPAAAGAEAGQRVGFKLKQVGDCAHPTKDWYSPIINFKPGGTDGRHFWRGTVGDAKWHHVDRYPSGNTYYSDPLCTELFVSDTLQSFFKSEKLTGWDAQKVLEKPPDWFFEQKLKGKVF